VRRQVIQVWWKDSKIINWSERTEEGVGGPGAQISIGVRPGDGRRACVSKWTSWIWEMGTGGSIGEGIMKRYCVVCQGRREVFIECDVGGGEKMT
jgi:hypothetical protein